ncbi:DASH complex, subunit Dam1 [Pseudohyphozyma bogoriensis]|nr:DASH complex, subunit Dam1 [Pseudohyphozyma bogoriensis]
MSTSRRPTTPLRRLSSSSLRTHSLSHSHSRAPDSIEPPLEHLQMVFAELADALSDLSGNMEQLKGVNDTLGGWNEAFASYLVGLRGAAYLADFTEGPTLQDFHSHAQRRPPTPPRSPTPTPSSPMPNNNALGGDDEGTELGNETLIGPADSEFSGRGGKTGITRRERNEQVAFAESIIQLLPIIFREQQPQRGATEKVILTVREAPSGISMPDIASLTSLPPHRVNESLTALVRAKVALKVLSKKYPSN